jgi:predicted SnoaL-like aldol condensation-catalyzing enzyme
MGEFTRDEIEAAWAEYQKAKSAAQPAGVGGHTTDDAHYQEHNLRVFEGRPAISTFIVDIMKEYPAMTLWIEWSIIDGDRIGFYIWNNLPDPTGTGKRYAFPNTTFLRYGGDGKFSFEADYYNPADAERVFKEWLTDGGRRDTPQDRTLRGIDGWNPDSHARKPSLVRSRACSMSGCRVSMSARTSPACRT